MSSILDALRKLESAETRVGRPTTDVGRSAQPPRAVVAIGVAAAFVTGAGVALWWGSRTPAREPGVVSEAPVAPRPALEPAPPPPPAAIVAPPPPLAATPAPPAPAAPAPVPAAAPAPVPHAVPHASAPPPVPPASFVALRPIAPTPPLPASLAAHERPRGQPASPEPTAPATPEASDPALPDTGVIAAVPPPVTTPPPPAPDALAPPPEPIPADVLPRPPMGAPRVHLSFLVYSRAPERRRVSLSVDGGGGMITLREGDDTAGLQVVRILPDAVHLRYGNVTYAVRAGE